MDNKGNYSDNWSVDYSALSTTYTTDEIKSRDDFYQQLGYEYTLEEIVKYINMH